MSPATAVIIATKGRPQELSSLLELLTLQTSRPAAIVVSATEDADVGQIQSNANVQVVFGPSGLTAQRNKALAAIRGKFEIIIFFDDDFIPSRFWIEHVKAFLLAHPEVVGVTGRVLSDGAKLSDGISLAEGQSLVDETDASANNPRDFTTKNHQIPYGCNMAFRANCIEHLTFDERLLLYGWLEDRDFGVRAGPSVRMVKTDCLWGVHLGTKRGRTSGMKFGYSQTVNPWYLMKKGTVGSFEACRYIASGVLRNGFGSIFENSSIDRKGRLRGNLVGIKDIVLGRWAPEKIVEL